MSFPTPRNNNRPPWIRDVALFAVLGVTLGLAGWVTGHHPKGVAFRVESTNSPDDGVPDGLNPLGPAAGKPLTAITYDGTTIPLRRPYRSLAEYIADPDKFTPAELARIAELVGRHKVPLRIQGNNALLTALIEARFPGFGLELKLATAGDAGSVQLARIELPGTGMQRILLYVGKGATFNLVDDRSVPNAMEISSVSIEKGEITYFDNRRARVLVVPLPDISKRP
jgi:hypothetical protein